MPTQSKAREEGRRERNRRETLQRIIDAGTKLFIAQGYEGTTLDAIAAEAGIGRRTFFSYFKSKDDILLAMQAGLGDLLAAALRGEPAGLTPFQAVRRAMIKSSGAYDPADMLVLDRVMRSSDAVMARKQASYVQHEATLLAALRERWPQPERETGLRLVAMLSIGALRVSLERFNRENGVRPIDVLLTEAFDALEIEI